MCACVCMWERESEFKCVCVSECVLVCVCERDRERGRNLHLPYHPYGERVSDEEGRFDETVSSENASSIFFLSFSCLNEHISLAARSINNV